MWIATNSAKNKIIGNATGPARLRDSARGFLGVISINGNTSRTPSVSPIHQEIQLVARSGRSMTPSASRPVNARAKHRREQQKTRQLANTIETLRVADDALQDRAANRGLHHR